MWQQPKSREETPRKGPTSMPIGNDAVHKLLHCGAYKSTYFFQYLERVVENCDVSPPFSAI